MDAFELQKFLTMVYRGKFETAEKKVIRFRFGFADVLSDVILNPASPRPI